MRMGEHDATRNNRFTEMCRRLDVEPNEETRSAFWAGIACGLLEQLLDDGRTTPEIARAMYADYLKGFKKLQEYEGPTGLQHP